MQTHFRGIISKSGDPKPICGKKKTQLRKQTHISSAESAQATLRQDLRVIDQIQRYRSKIVDLTPNFCD